MEQNKTLMIVVSVAVFLAAIVGVGVALLYPRAEGVNPAEAGGNTQEFDPIEYVRRPEAAPLTPIGEEETVIIVYGAEEKTVESESTADVPPESVPAVAAGADKEPTVPAPEPRTFGPNRQSRQAVAVPVEATPQPQTTRVTEYWIQLIASPSQDRVEQARESLTELGLGGRITTRDVDGTVYYRLRVGPYESKEEAEKFLEWIHGVDRFAGAYISEEYPIRTLGG